MSNSRTIKPDDKGSVKGAARAPEGMAGLAKGLAVIEAFGIRHPQLTVTDAAQRTNTSRAAARRCLLTLVELGYLTHDNGNFRPTPRMLRLGGAYLDTAPLPQLAQPQLVEARDALGESVSLAVLEDGCSLFVARAEAARIVATGVRVGAKLPAPQLRDRSSTAGRTSRYASRRLPPRMPPAAAHTQDTDRCRCHQRANPDREGEWRGLHRRRNRTRHAVDSRTGADCPGRNRGGNECQCVHSQNHPARHP